MALEARRRIMIEHGRSSARTPTFAWWTWGPAEVGGSVLVSVTDFHLQHTGDLLRVYLAGLRLSRAWGSMSGAVGMWLWTKPLGKRSGSVSVWRSEEDLRRRLRLASGQHLTSTHAVPELPAARLGPGVPPPQRHARVPRGVRRRERPDTPHQVRRPGRADPTRGRRMGSNRR